MSERTRIRGIAQREAPRPRRVEGAAVLALTPAPGPRPAGQKWEASQATVAVRGELDRDALWAIDYTIGRASLEAGRIVLDLREVTHLDYAGVPELVARRRASAALRTRRSPTWPWRARTPCAAGSSRNLRRVETSSCSLSSIGPCCAARPWTFSRPLPARCSSTAPSAAEGTPRRCSTPARA